MALTPLDITAEVRPTGGEQADVITVRGQVAVATAPGEVLSVSLVPEDAAACPEALAAIREADWVVLGPGSWFSSVIPHLLVPELRDALCSTRARVVVATNLEPHADETRGYDLADHLDVLSRHAPDLRVHTVLADPGAVRDRARLEQVAGVLGARLATHDVASDTPGVHHARKLAAAYAAVFDEN